jgi:hypothetical protein
MDYLKDLELNIRERIKLLNECDKSDDVKKSIISICKRDPIFFFKYFVYTDRNPSMIPDSFGNVVPFILFKYQEEFVEDAWDAIKM